MGLPTNPGRVVAEFRGDGGIVCLVVYPDESWGILRDGETVLTWGPDGTADCMAAFVRMGGFDAGVTSMGVLEGHEDRPPVTAPLTSVLPWRADRRRHRPPVGEQYRFN